MKINLLDLLLPRETKFYDHFNAQAEILVNASAKLKELFHSIGSLNDDGLKTYISTIKEFEQQGDKIERVVLEDLNSTFITPFDREDIHHLSSNIDIAVDKIYSMAHKLDIYAVRTLPANAINFVDIIYNMAVELQKCLKTFKTSKKIEDYVKAVHKYENNADYLFSISIAELFRDHKDAIEVVKLKDVYNDLENITDQIDFVGKLLRRIVIKMG